MELAFLTPLLKDGAHHISGSVAINDKGVFKMRLSEDWGSANGIDKGLEGGFVFIFPVEPTPFGTVSN